MKPSSMVSLERNQTLMKINKKLSRLWLPCITKVSPQYRSLLAQTDGAFISTLLSLSKSSSPIIQTLSPSVLLNLSLNPDLKQPLASIETVCISSQLASSLNCRLAMVDKNKKAKFGVAVPVKAISLHTCPAGHHLLSSLAERVQFQGNSTLAVQAGTVPELIQSHG